MSACACAPTCICAASVPPESVGAIERDCKRTGTEVAVWIYTQARALCSSVRTDVQGECMCPSLGSVYTEGVLTRTGNGFCPLILPLRWEHRGTCLFPLSSPGETGSTGHQAPLSQSLTPPGLLGSSLKGRPLGGGSGEGTGGQSPRHKLGPSWFLGCLDSPPASLLVIYPVVIIRLPPNAPPPMKTGIWSALPTALCPSAENGARHTTGARQALE